jgi:hypothetical protein
MRHAIAIAAVTAASCLLLSCSKEGRASRSSRDTEEKCDFDPGALVYVMVDPRPIPAPAGGAVQDGVYDLVSLVSTCGSSAQVGPRGVRATMSLVTTERNGNLQAGTAQVLGGDAIADPVCREGRFAIYGNTFETQLPTGRKASPYTVTPEGFILFDPAGGPCDPHVLVYRRR